VFVGRPGRSFLFTVQLAAYFFKDLLISFSPSLLGFVRLSPPKMEHLCVPTFFSVSFFSSAFFFPFL